LVEDDAIVGNADKLTFHIKDMMSNLTAAKKESINPFIIGKLDIDTVAHFDFPSINKDQNQYLLKKQGNSQVQVEFEVAQKIAENNSKQGSAA
jgi:hypothetical protein